MGTLTCAFFFIPNFTIYKSTGDNHFTIKMYGETVGVVGSEAEAYSLMDEARKQLQMETDKLYMVSEPNLELVGEESLIKKTDSPQAVKDRMVELMSANHKDALESAYTVKVNSEIVNLATKDDVETLLKKALLTYDTEGIYDLKLDRNEKKVFDSYTADVYKKADEFGDFVPMVGIENDMNECIKRADDEREKSFDEYQYGLRNIEFSEEVEVAGTYVNKSEISDIDTALNLLTNEQDVQQIYEVQAGDTLSEISIKVGIPMEDIVAMNKDTMEDINSTIRENQALVITVPEPTLSVIWTERTSYEESYEADIIYIDNDDWYTNQKVTVQEASAGYRRIVADMTYENDTEIDKLIVKEDILMEAVPKIIERGTKIPPTYIKPISGGRFTSGFGRRTAPTAGASTFHKGIDWATPVGTTVVASCGGTVSRAGWAKGYGNVIFIDHPDGRQTRYGHLSKIYVSVGQKVSQGEKIAASGNTGVSTGPHIHFEILINGSQVNPLSYMN